MISKDKAKKFATEWVEAWNAHDLDRVLDHYTNDFEMSSPFIVAFTGEATGSLKGKTQVRNYWQSALDHMPDLRFELLEVCIGVDSIAIYYNAVLGKRAVEVFFFNESGKVCRALAHYNE